MSRIYIIGFKKVKLTFHFSREKDGEALAMFYCNDEQVRSVQLQRLPPINRIALPLLALLLLMIPEILFNGWGLAGWGDARVKQTKIAQIGNQNMK